MAGFDPSIEGRVRGGRPFPRLRSQVVARKRRHKHNTAIAERAESCSEGATVSAFTFPAVAGNGNAALRKVPTLGRPRIADGRRLRVEPELERRDPTNCGATHDLRAELGTMSPSSASPRRSAGEAASNPAHGR